MAAKLERALRITTLITNIIAFPLVIPAGIESQKTNRWYSSSNGVSIYFGFIPLTFSLITGVLYFILNRKQTEEETAHKPRPLLWLSADFLIFTGYLVMLVYFWLLEPDWLGNEVRVAMFEAYASMPLVVNMFVHAILVLLNSRYLWYYIAGSDMGKFFSGTTECPNCHHQIGRGPQNAGKGKKRGEGYSLLRGEDYDEDVPRASEESAGDRIIAEV